MSRVKDPGNKKRLSLERDHRVFALEGNKTFRKAWRLKKAKASRRLRHVQARELAKLQDDRERPRAKPKRTLKKLGVMSLSQAIAFKGGQLGQRWDLAILGANKDARRAVPKSKKTK
jgi:hypothetical protein